MKYVIALLLPVMLFAQEGAPGAPAAPGAGGLLSMLPMLAIMFGIVYFLMIRPEQRKQKQRQKMLEAVKRGDKVVTAGGIHGTIASVRESTVTVKVAEGVSLEFSKASVQQVLKPGEDKEKKSETKSGDTK